LAKGRRTPDPTDAQAVSRRTLRARATANPSQAARGKAEQHRPAADNSAPPETAPTSRMGPQASPTSPAMRLHTWWSNATKWTKAICAALVSLATIIAALPVIVPAVARALHPPRSVVLSQSVADANTLNSLKAGELFSAFQSSLKVSPTANVWRRAVQIKYDAGSDLVSDYLFILPTVHVEAFVGGNGTVDAYTITARTSDMPQGISILGRKYDLGKTTLAALGDPSLVADVCAAHITAYYEISGTAEAQLNQTVAVGLTVTGSIPRNSIFPDVLCASTDLLALAAGAPGYNPQSGYYRIEERFPTAAYLANSLNLRKKMLINAVTITAPGYPVAPEMISLHPEEVDLYSPKLHG
jgi:hypothetical protein